MCEDEEESSGSVLLQPVPAPNRSKVLWRWMLGLVILVDLIGLGQWFLVRKDPTPVGTVMEELGNLVSRDGHVYLRDGTNAFTGWMISRYPDGTMKSRALVSSGLLDGVSEGWFPNGVRQVEERFVAGVSEGPVTHWREDGSKLSEGVSHHGKLEGVFRRWHANGLLAEEIPMHAGKPDGLSRAWHTDGQLKAEAILRDGHVVSQVFHDPDPKQRRTNLLTQGGDE